MDFRTATVEFDGTEFWLNPTGAFMPAEAPTDGTGQIAALRNPTMVERYVRMRDELDIRRIFELGIWRGGSTALLEAIFKPAGLAAIELKTERAAVLDHYVSQRGLERVVHSRYGVDQADQEAMLEVARAAFGDEPIDLVIDDASHRYLQTKASFRTLFPLLREGGLYVIEDWAWAVLQHDPETQEGWKKAFAQLHDFSRPLSAFVGKLTIATPTTDLIATIEISDEMVIVERGPGDIAPGFDVDALQVTSAEQAFLRARGHD